MLRNAMQVELAVLSLAVPGTLWCFSPAEIGQVVASASWVRKRSCKRIGSKLLPASIWFWLLSAAHDIYIFLYHSISVYIILYHSISINTYIYIYCWLVIILIGSSFVPLCSHLQVWTHGAASQTVISATDVNKDFEAASSATWLVVVLFPSFSCFQRLAFLTLFPTFCFVHAFCIFYCRIMFLFMCFEFCCVMFYPFPSRWSLQFMERWSCHWFQFGPACSNCCACDQALTLNLGGIPGVRSTWNILNRVQICELPGKGVRDVLWRSRHCNQSQLHGCWLRRRAKCEHVLHLGVSTKFLMIFVWVHEDLLVSLKPEARTNGNSAGFNWADHYSGHWPTDLCNVGCAFAETLSKVCNVQNSTAVKCGRRHSLQVIANFIKLSKLCKVLILNYFEMA